MDVKTDSCTIIHSTGLIDEKTTNLKRFDQFHIPF